MLTVVTLSSDSPETCSPVPEVISHAADVATVRDHLRSDLALTTDDDYATQVLAWFDMSRDVPGLVTNPDGTVDVWMYDAVENELAA